MSVLPIYTYNQPVLRKKARPVRSVDETLRRSIDDMFDTMHVAGGIGLAANQVGLLQRVIVLDLSGMDEGDEFKPLALINPEIVAEEGSWTLEEGCLSLPELRDEVDRAEKVVVRYRDLQFEEQQIRASDMYARVLQHEIDHINGVLFIDHLNILKRKLLRGRLNKIARGEIAVSYPIVGESGVVQPESTVRKVQVL